MLRTCLESLRMLLLLLILLVSPLASNAKELDLKEFRKITVLAEGRYKPLDSYARNLLLRFSGKSKLKKMDAMEWFTKTVFEPSKASNEPIFLINNPEILEAIELKAKKHRRYSFDELEPGFEALYEFASKAAIKEETDRSMLDKEFMRVYSNLDSYNQMLDFLAFFHKYSQMASKQSSEEELMKLAFDLYAWIESHRELWQAMLLTDKTKEKLIALNDITGAYYAKDQNLFDQSLKLLQELNNLGLSKQAPKTDLEINYNRINPFGNAKFLYGAAFLLAMLSLIYLPKLFQLASLSLTMTGFALHCYGLVTRIMILERPPVTNLYETFIFVALISAIIGLLLYYLVDKNLGLILTSFVALLMLLISGKFAGDGDNFKVLIAVLDSNFWLSTHVVCISIGYAGCFVAGVIGHVALIQTSLNQWARSSKLEARFQQQNDLTKIILAVLAFGLCFSFLGTMLGGIWADQSWGRFWGWDPKENGALLIVLWSTIVFHARLAGLIKETGIAVLSVIGCIVVITSWFGINLLGVGLHSYGFTEGLATGLYSYYAFEILFLAITLLLQGFYSNSNHQPAQQS